MRALALTLVVLGWTAVAGAQTLRDPTRPPGADFAPEVAEASDGPVLQSVLISPAMKAAIISGVMVRIGEKYGGAELVQVAEHEVVLKEGATTQVLKMYPSVRVTKGEPAAPAARAKPVSRGARGPGG